MAKKSRGWLPEVSTGDNDTAVDDSENLGQRNTLANPDFAKIGLKKFWHPSKNSGLDAGEITYGSKQKIFLQCNGCP